MNNTKKCCRCKVALPANADFFFRKKASKDGLTSACKKCKGSKYGHNKKGLIDLSCEYCSGEFTVEYNQKSKRFCSRKCYNSWIQENGSPKKNGHHFNCINCGQEYYRSLSDKTITCSNVCSGQYKFKQNIKAIETKHNIESLKEYLIEEYTNKGLTYRELNKRLGINVRTCTKLLNYYGIPINYGQRNYSLGEKAIKNWLSVYELEYKTEYWFEDCRRIYPLPFDFAVFDNGQLLFLIEYDGQQHFEPVELFGGLEAHLKVKENDSIKNEYCKANGIELVRIPYWEQDNIDKILSDKFNSIYKPKQLALL